MLRARRKKGRKRKRRKGGENSGERECRRHGGRGKK
jgi:hypothetical protein